MTLYVILYILVGVLTGLLAKYFQKEEIYLWEFIFYAAVWPVALVVSLIVFVKYNDYITNFWQKFLKIKI